MSGKFMKVKRIIIPTITMVIIASQLMGCSAATKSELLDMIDRGEQIEIEVANPDFYAVEQGEQSTLVWEQLALLETNPTLRKNWEDILGIIGSGESKNGIFFVDASGNQDINNTLAVALRNREFQKLLDGGNTDTSRSLAEATADNYADIEINDANNRNELLKAVYIGINAYFNLLPDSTPNYSNPDDTIMRSEYMAMIFRADTPVQDIESDGVLTNAVGQSEYNLYAQGVVQNSYLDLESQSLNNKTYNGNISRAEAIYILVNRYFYNELQLVDLNGSGVTFSDAIDGGNIAEQQKFIENGEKKTYWKSYELTYCLQNPDKGITTELYKALIVAQQNGLIGTETRWDEAITRAEAIELLVKALMNSNSTVNEVYSAKQGTNTSYEINDTTEVDEVYDSIEDGVAEPSEMDAVINSYDDNINEEVKEPEDNVITDYEVQPIDPITLYALQTVNLRQGPSADDYAKIGSLSPRQQVTVVGEVREYKGKSVYWYQLDTGEFVSAAYLSTTLPPVQSTQPSGSNNSGNTDSGNSGQQSSGSSGSSGGINIGGLQFPDGFSTEGSGQINGGGGSNDGDGSLANDGIVFQ